MPWPWLGYNQWEREKNAVFAGYGDICFDAIHAALSAYGLSDFDPLSRCLDDIQYTFEFIPLEETEQTSFSEIEGY
jgi:hypothetical protein